MAVSCLSSLSSPSSLDGYRDRSSAAIGDLRDRDTQLAVDQRGVRALGVAGAVQAHRTRKPAEAALDQMEGGVASAAPRRLLADDQDRVRLHQHANGGRLDAR